MNNYTSQLNNIIIKYKHKDTLEVEYKFLLSIKKKLSIKKGNVKEIILEFNKKLLEMSMNPEIINIGVNLTIATDVETDKSFTILPNIEKNLEDNYDIFDIEIFFPKNNRININEYNKRILEIIDKVLPQEMREEISNNYNKFIENDK